MSAFEELWRFRKAKPQQGLGIEVEPQTALLGIGALMLAVFLVGMKAEPKIRARRKKRREEKIGKLRRKLKELEVGRIEDFEGD